MSGDEDLTHVRKKRSAAKGWLTRAGNKLKDVSESSDTTETLLTLCLEDFQKRLSNFDLVQTEVECLLESDELEKDIEEIATFRDDKLICLTLAQEKLLTFRQKPDPSDNSSEINAPRSSSHSSVSAKLPKLELPRFSGCVTEWYSFWDKFNAVVHDSSLPEVTKFTYLQCVLRGEALDAIKGLATTAESYQVARDILVKRFGRKERIIFGHIQKLLTTPSAKHSTLWNLHDDLLASVRSLEQLGVGGDAYGVVLTPLLLHRLPNDIRLEWARVGEGKEGDLSFLLDFLYAEIGRRERSQTFDSFQPGIQLQGRKDRVFSSPQSCEMKPKAHATPSVAAFVASENPYKRCAFCTGEHYSDQCSQIKDLDLDKRKEKVKKMGLCFICLKSNHLSRSCTSGKNCGWCKGKHHRVLCMRNFNNKSAVKNTFKLSTYEGNSIQDLGRGGSVRNLDANAPVFEPLDDMGTMAYCNAKASNVHTVMQTVHTELKGRRVAILFDSGSDRSFISKDLAKSLKLPVVRQESVSFACFGEPNKLRRNEPRKIRKLAGNWPELELIEIECICAPMFRAKIPDEHAASFGDIQFGENYGEGRKITIDILIGLDYYWALMKQDMIRSPVGLVAQLTSFGWMLSGSWPSKTENDRSHVSHLNLCLQNIPESLIRKFWDLESVGILSDEQEEASDVLKNFRQTVHQQDGRYIVHLPWKHSCQKDQLMDNEIAAQKRMSALDRKLSSNLDLKNRYDEALLDLENEGIIHEVTTEELSSPSGHPVFYLPHRPVVKESSQTTKIRPVFDASASGPNGISLNDCMEAGPSLIPNLVSVLLRFRRWKFACCADITKAFLQIRVHIPDQNVHRFLWNLEGKIRVMRFDRVPFGNKASPFLLNATIQHHLSLFPETKAVSELKTNLYVDDFLSGADSIEEMSQIKIEAIDVMSKARMCLTKWSSNLCEVRPMEKSFNESEFKYTESDALKVLGLKWNPVNDCFSFDCLTSPNEMIITKRLVLSFIARLFDPLGFLTPFSVKAKIIFQQLWVLGIEWDTCIPESLASEFDRWLKGLCDLQSFNIFRRCTTFPWTSVATRCDLHIFCDASEKAYGFCAYLRSWQGKQVSVSLIYSRARVAPVKRVTLPRLELLATLLGAKTVNFLRESLELPPNVQYTCYTDSQIALCWIQSKADRWKPFVSNRVREIQGLTDPACWSHCPGSENPADLVSRGLHASDLLKSELWLEGPSWLQYKDVTVHDLAHDSTDYGEIETMLLQEVEPSTFLTKIESESFLPLSRWSSFDKAIRIVGWILRFCRRTRHKEAVESLPYITQEEFGHAEIVLLRLVQKEQFSEEFECLENGKSISKSSVLFKLQPFIDNQGLLRMRGRIQLSPLSFDEKHPIIIPKGHFALLLARFFHLSLKHAGVKQIISTVRNRFWVIGLRTMARKVKRECFFCQKLDARSSDQMVAPLPGSRVSRSPPFSVIGIDYAGPLYCADLDGQKSYILLITCAVTRAIHLELVPSLSLSDFMLAFRRFVSRRGLPSIIYSDNAKTFIGAPQEILRYYGCSGLKWRFIAPRAPWWGGFYERMVKSVKFGLKKTIQKRSLNRAELETTLIEIEACVNSRPLTSTDDEDVKEGDILTPNHFLIGRSCFLVPGKSPTVLPSGKNDMHKRYSNSQEFLDHYWKNWSQDYIRHLPQVRSGPKGSGLKEGTLVLIREDNTPRLCWPVGVVNKMIIGRDGLARTYEVRTNKGVVIRPVQRLHSLELESPALQSEINDLVGDPGDDGSEQIRPQINTDVKIRDSQSISVRQGTSQNQSVVENGKPKIVVSRYGRQTKAVKRLDL